MLVSVVMGETRARRASVKRRNGRVADPSFFFSAKKFFRGPALAGANESDSGKYSGSWRAKRLGVLRAERRAKEIFRSHRSSHHRFILLPAFTFGLAEDWHLGSRIQLQQRNCLRISRSSVHRIAVTKLAKNCREVAVSRALPARIYLSCPRFFRH